MPDPPARVFISYKHKVEPDQSVVNQVVEAFEPHHTVFIDKKTLPGLEWGKWIQERIAESDFLIVFLTARSASSEMVKKAIRVPSIARPTAQTAGSSSPQAVMEQRASIRE